MVEAGPTAVPGDLVARFGDAITAVPDSAWELAVAPEELLAALTFLGRDRQPPFDYFVDLFGVDYGEELEVVYHLSRVMTRELVRVRVRVPRRAAKVTTVTDIWAGASWPERELMEMFGIQVEGHPDPRNLLLPEGWKGFPLRKDYRYPEEHPWLKRDALHEEPVSALPQAEVQEGTEGTAP